MQFWQHVGGFSTVATPGEASEEVQGAFRWMRALGWLVAVSGALAVVNSLIITPINIARMGGMGGMAAGGMFIVTTILSMLWAVAFAIGVLFWIGWTLSKFADGVRAGHTSALVLSIWGIVWFGIGTLLAVVALGIVAYSSMADTTTFTLGSGAALLSVPITLAQLVLSILLLVGLQKPEVKQHFGMSG